MPAARAVHSDKEMCRFRVFISLYAMDAAVALIV